MALDTLAGYGKVVLNLAYIMVRLHTKDYLLRIKKYENQISELLNVSKVTLNKWRSKDILKKNIHYIKIGRSLRYKKRAIINFDS